MPDKLSIINGALGELGENLVAVADDGSDEWNCCSPAYENAVPETIEAHDWGFDTTVVNLVRTGAPTDDLYTDAMAMPVDSLHLIWVRVRDVPADYRIINNQICLSLNGYTATAKYVRDNGTGAWPPSFVKIIRTRVMAAIFTGLREDVDGGLKLHAMADKLLQEARTRVDQQQPKRAVFNSRAQGARLVRRPFVNTPASWGGTGVPS